MRKTIAACAATALVVGGGTATAASLITSSDIADGTIQNRDIKAGAISLKRLTPGLQALIAKAGQPGRDGVNGAKGVTGGTGGTGEAGAAGAKGDAGTKGDAGANGDAGVQGPEGPQGPQGVKGDRGADGIDDARPVTDDDLQGWTLAPKGDNGSTVDNGTLTFAEPPVAAPLGVNALRMVTDTGMSVVAFLPLPAAPGSNPLLSTLTTAGYTSRSNAIPANTNDVSFQVEVLGAAAPESFGGYATVVYEPYLNARLANSAFQRHNVRAGKVWTSQTIVGAVGDECKQAEPCEMSRFIALNPTATVTTVKLRIGQNSGEGWTGFVGYVDDVRLGFDGDFDRYDLGA